MKWSEVPFFWRVCFQEAWATFKEGSRPIAAIIVNEQGEIVAKGKNAIFTKTSESVVAYNDLAHAEMNALLKLDNRNHKKRNTYTLYSTLEPCPLCFGAFYMSGIRHLQFAGKDKFAGSTNLQGTTPYLSLKPIQLTGPIPFLEDLSILLNIYYDYVKLELKTSSVHDQMEEDYPQAVSLAREWAKTKRVEVLEQLDIQAVYELMVRELR